MAKITIYLSVDEPGKLHLRDSEGHTGEDNITTDVGDGDTLVWTLEENSGIKAITDIGAKPGSPNLFTSGPTGVSDTEWSGVIASTAEGEEAYYIEYTLSDGIVRRDDPKILIRP